jgi:hypothetical protein
MPPRDWNHTKDEWTAMLNKPKNLGLKAGGGTGISALLGSAHTADHAFPPTLHVGQETMKHYRDLESALDALTKRCKEVSDKHKKLFTEACTLVDRIKADATSRKVQATTELDNYKAQIHQDFMRVLNDVKQSQSNDNLEALWDAFVNHYEALARGFPFMRGFAGQMKAAPKPTGPQRKPKEAYVKWITDSTQATMYNDH